MARSSSNPPPFSVGPSSTHTRTRSPSRSSRSEVGDLKFHPEPTPSTPTPAITAPVMIPPVIPPSLLNTSASSPVSPTSLRKSPPPLPTKPIVRPTLAYPSGPSPPIPQMSPNPPSLSVPPPLPVRVPSPTRPHPPAYRLHHSAPSSVHLALVLSLVLLCLGPITRRWGLGRWMPGHLHLSLYRLCHRGWRG